MDFLEMACHGSDGRLNVVQRSNRSRASRLGKDRAVEPGIAWLHASLNPVPASVISRTSENGCR